MPAGIAVKVNHAKLNTQEKCPGASADQRTSGKKSSEADGKEKVFESDFKKLLDKKIVKKGKEELKPSSGKKADSETEKTAESKKLNPEKLSEKQAETAPLGSSNVSSELKAESLISADSDFKKEAAESVKKSAEKNSRIASVSFTAASELKKSAAGKELKSEAAAEKIKSTDREAETVKKDNVKLQVLDLRSGEKSRSESGSSFSASENNGEKFELHSEATEQKTDSSQNQIKDVLFIKAENSSDIKNEEPVKSLTAQQTAVLEKLKADGNTEIVKQTKMILNDNNSGELRMVLKPERLGFVRIKLNLDDNNIVGRIIVDNNNIKEIFENNMENLLRNFRENGFSSASLEVSVGGGKGQQQNKDSNERFFSKKIIEDVDKHNIISSSQNSLNTETLIDLVV